jgi:hypothetical protein
MPALQLKKGFLGASIELQTRETYASSDGAALLHYENTVGGE